MNQGPQQHSLWTQISNLSYRADANEVHQWLEHHLPFWDNHVFNSASFVNWYSKANFMDREIVYKYLTPTEQVQVLKNWAMTIQPSLVRTPQLETAFLDNPPPIRNAKQPTPK